MPPPWRSAATIISRSSSSTSASRAIWPRCWPAEALRRSCRTRSDPMTATLDKSDLQRRMHGAVEVLKHDLGGLRTGRASTALLDSINVEVYGAQMPLNQVATVSVPEARRLGVPGRAQP